MQKDQESSFAIIPLTQGKYAIVDPWHYKALSSFTWRAVQAQRNWYAKTTIRKEGKDITISMHRFIARTPFGMVCHHENLNSLDNREFNLKNKTKKLHDAEHANNRILIKFEKIPWRCNKPAEPQRLTT